jgi:hypothetical protein
MRVHRLKLVHPTGHCVRYIPPLTLGHFEETRPRHLVTAFVHNDHCCQTETRIIVLSCDLAKEMVEPMIVRLKRYRPDLGNQLGVGDQPLPSRDLIHDDARFPLCPFPSSIVEPVPEAVDLHRFFSP